MNKKIFWTISALLFALFIISIIFDFKLAAAGFLVAMIMLLEIKFSLKPLKSFGVYNPLKGYYQRKGKLEAFRKISIIMFVIFFILGILGFIQGVFGR